MFEKEAKIYALSNFGFRGKDSQRVLTAKIDYQYGAEFGYKKANEWHYVKDGNLPPKTTLVLIKACGCFILGWLDDNDIWHNDSDNGARIPKENIYAWKEIVLPELKESE